MGSSLKARKEKRNLHRDLIELIIYFACRKEREIPGIKKVLLSSIILASCDFVSDGEEICDHYGNNKSWEEKLTRRFSLIIDEFGDFLHPDLKEMLYNLSEFRKKIGYEGRYGNIFYDFFEFYSESREQSVIDLPDKFNQRIEKEVMPKLDSVLIEQCQSIGELTIKYLKKEIREIKKRNTNPR